MDQYILLTLSKDELTELIEKALQKHKQAQDNNLKENRLVKIPDLCAILKVSRATIHKWKKEGRIPYRRISNRVFFDLDEVLTSLHQFNLKKGGTGYETS